MIEKETYETIKTLEDRIKKQKANIEKNYRLIQKALRKGIVCPKCGSTKIVCAIVRDLDNIIFKVNYYCVQHIPPAGRCDEIWSDTYDPRSEDGSD